MALSKHSLRDDALALWPYALGQAYPDLDPASFDVQVLKLLDSDTARRVVLSAFSEVHPNLVMKYEANDKSHAAMGRSTEIQNAAYRRAKKGAGPQVARIVWDDPTRGLQLIEHVVGATAADRLKLAEVGLDDDHDILRSCAEWIGKFHRASDPSMRVLDVTAQSRRIRRQAKAVREGARTVVAPHMFLGLCA